MAVLRTARAGEAHLLTAIALRSKAHWGYDAAFMEACRDELTVTEHALSRADHAFGVAAHAESIVGFYGVSVMDGRAELEFLFIDTPYFGQGTGTRLFDEAVRAARCLGASEMRVQSDPHADAFYRRMGCRAVGTLPSQSIPGRQLTEFSLELQAVTP